MKKMIMSLAACGLILSSCSSNDVFEENQENNNPNVINFSATTTRATVNNLDNVKEGFPVYAVTSGKIGPKPKENADSWYIAGQTYSFDKETKSWKWTIVQQSFPSAPQWPVVDATNKIHFYAYYPATHAGYTDDNPNASSAGALSSVITIQGTAGEQADYLAANTSNQERIPQGGSVPLAFKHITTKINFGVNAADGTKVYVQQMNINNVKNKGTYDYVKTEGLDDILKSWTLIDFTMDGAEPSKPVKPAYDYYQTTAGGSVVKPAVVFPKTDNQTSFYPCTPEGTGQSQLTAADKHLMLLPQKETPVWTPVVHGTTPTDQGNQTEATEIKPAGKTITPLKAYIGSVYRMTSADGNTDLVGYTKASSHPNHPNHGKVSGDTGYDNNAYDGPLFVKVGFPLNNGFEWTMGKAYTYNISLGGLTSSGGYILDDRYYDEKGNPTDLTINGKDPGEPVSGGTINFDVTVGEWTDGDNQPGTIQ